jgi:hypothetical protein
MNASRFVKVVVASRTGLPEAMIGPVAIPHRQALKKTRCPGLQVGDGLGTHRFLEAVAHNILRSYDNKREPRKRPHDIPIPQEISQGGQMESQHGQRSKAKKTRQKRPTRARRPTSPPFFIRHWPPRISLEPEAGRLNWGGTVITWHGGTVTLLPAAMSVQSGSYVCRVTVPPWHCYLAL